MVLLHLCCVYVLFQYSNFGYWNWMHVVSSYITCITICITTYYIKSLCNNFQDQNTQYCVQGRWLKSVQLTERKKTPFSRIQFSLNRWTSNFFYYCAKLFGAGYFQFAEPYAIKVCLVFFLFGFFSFFSQHYV